MEGAAGVAARMSLLHRVLWYAWLSLYTKDTILHVSCLEYLTLAMKYSKLTSTWYFKQTWRSNP